MRWSLTRGGRQGRFGVLAISFPSILLSMKGKAIEILKFAIGEKRYQEFIHSVFI